MSISLLHTLFTFWCCSVPNLLAPLYFMKESDSLASILESTTASSFPFEVTLLGAHAKKIIFQTLIATQPTFSRVLFSVLPESNQRSYISYNFAFLRIGLKYYIASCKFPRSFLLLSNLLFHVIHQNPARSFLLLARTSTYFISSVNKLPVIYTLLVIILFHLIPHFPHSFAFLDTGSIK